MTFCLLAGGIFAQSNQQQITLLDLDDALPIIGASYQYGKQSGITTENGEITFNYTEGNIMKISHLNYGSWEWKDEELQQIAQKQVYYRASITFNLYPVTVIEVRPQDKQPDEQLAIDYQEKMEHDAAAILNQIPSFNSIRKSGNYGFDPVFRGYKYDQLNIVLNGAQSATAACPNRMDPPTSQMSPNMMDRIEVLKGPYALRYGTGFGATINFIPSKLQFSDSTKVYGRASAGYKGNGNVATGEAQVGLSGKKYDFNLFGSWAQGDDYQSGNGDTVQADFTRGSFGAILGLKISDKQQLRLSATYNRARDVDFPALPMDLRNDDTWLFNARHDININGNNLQSWNTTLFGSFVDHLMDNLLKPLNPRPMNAQTYAQTYNYGGRTESVWLIGKGKLFGGADLRVEGAKGTRTREFLMGPMAGKILEDNAWQDSRIIKAGLFGEYHLKTTVFNYVFSGRLEFNNGSINDPSDDFTQVNAETEVNQINPSLSFGLLKPFPTDIQLGLWLGRSQRSGSLTERYINYFPVGQDPYEMLGNPELSSEVNNQIDLTFEWKKEKTVINVDVFASYMQNYISSVIDTSLTPTLPASPGVRRYINIDDAFKTGFEISWVQQLPLGLQQQLGIAYTYAQDLVRDQPLPEIPPMDFRYVLAGSYFKNKLKPEIVFRYVTEQTRISSEFGESASPSFALLDVKIGYSITKMLKVNVGVNNLFNENYYEHLSRNVRGTMGPIYAPGRNIYANLSFVF